MNFVTKLNAAQQRHRSRLCLGLDIVVAKTPLPLLYADEPMLPFARAIIEATQDAVCAYKIDLAYYFAEGAAGMVALERIVRLIPDDIPLIFDLGLATLGASAAAYARGAFQQFRADAVIVWPQGHEAVIGDILSEPNRAVIVDVPAEEPMYALRWMQKWRAESPEGSLGMVAYPEQTTGLRVLRGRLPDIPFLVRQWQPDYKDKLRDLGPARNGAGFVVCASDEVLYATRTMEFAEGARTAAQVLRERLNLGW